jgi:hypothetical protein
VSACMTESALFMLEEEVEAAEEPDDEVVEAEGGRDSVWIGMWGVKVVLRGGKDTLDVTLRPVPRSRTENPGVLKVVIFIV